MAYVNNTIVNADPAAQLISAIETALASHANWDLIESGLVISTSTFSVWRNNGSGPGANVFGQNFYLAIEKNSTTAIRFKCFEAYTLASGVAANARMIRPCRSPGSATVTPNADGSFGLVGGYTLSDTSNSDYNGFISLPTGGFEYFLIVSNNYLRLGLRSGANDAVCENGLFESALPVSGTPETFPLFIGVGGSSSVYTYSGSSATECAASRHPNLPDATARASLFSLSWNQSDQGPMIGGPSSTEYDRHQGSGMLLAGRPWLQQRVTPRATYGYIRGRQRDMVTLASFPGTLRIGDDYTMGGEVWLAWLFNGNSATRCWVRRDVT